MLGFLVLFGVYYSITLSALPQAMVVEKALVIHKSKIDSSLQGLQEKLETCFEEFLCMVYPDRKVCVCVVCVCVCVCVCCMCVCVVCVCVVCVCVLCV